MGVEMKAVNTDETRMLCLLSTGSGRQGVGSAEDFEKWSLEIQL